jgi:hypothetical protein
VLRISSPRRVYSCASLEPSFAASGGARRHGFGRTRSTTLHLVVPSTDLHLVVPSTRVITSSAAAAYARVGNSRRHGSPDGRRLPSGWSSPRRARRRRCGGHQPLSAGSSGSARSTNALWDACGGRADQHAAGGRTPTGVVVPDRCRSTRLRH